MNNRREFIKAGMKIFTVLPLLLGTLSSLSLFAWARNSKKVLSPDTSRKSLINQNPAELDASRMKITPLEDFRTMGLTDYETDLQTWRLIVDGKVNTPLNLSYEQIRSMNPFSKTVLLICPGVFANHGRWKGVSLKDLLAVAHSKKDVSHVTVRGPKGHYENLARFPIQDILTDKVFLAYEVNGTSLPIKHGFPLRVVAEGYYGYEWIKYVYKVTVERIPEKNNN